jgi:hypothetical protein
MVDGCTSRTPSIDAIFAYASCFNGYEALGSFEAVSELASKVWSEFTGTGRWRGSARELRLCLFFEYRRWHHIGYPVEGESLRHIEGLFESIQGAIREGDLTPNDPPGMLYSDVPAVVLEGQPARLLWWRERDERLPLALDISGLVLFVPKGGHTVEMPVRPSLGSSYTREQINAMLGGGVQAFLPTKNGRVVCGCFKLDLNPDAPKEVLVGEGPQRVRSAEIAVLQRTPFPIFLKRDVDEWEYVGDYRAVRYLDRGHKLLEAEERSKREGIAGILYMEVAP